MIRRRRGLSRSDISAAVDLINQLLILESNLKKIHDPDTDFILKMMHGLLDNDIVDILPQNYSDDGDARKLHGEIVGAASSYTCAKIGHVKELLRRIGVEP